MNLHSSWLATAMLLFVVFACNSTNNSNSNSNNSNSTEKPTNRPANAEIYVDRLNMAKDDDGKPGDPTTSYAPDDHTVHTVIVLNKAKSGTVVRFVWIAANVEGRDKNEELKSLEYTTKAFEDKVHGHLTWSKDWAKGDYRVDVYVNGVLDKKINYTIE